MQQQRTIRVGLAAILCALCLRALSMGLPQRLTGELWRRGSDLLGYYIETGRNVRFSPSLAAFSPDFVESPQPEGTKETAPPLPEFTGTEGVELFYAADVRPDTTALLTAPLTWNLMGKTPTVLILHTHGTESYTKAGESYEESSRWRTLDEDYNMLSIGERVAQLLAEKGITALHDRTLHDYPAYNDAYVHAREAVMQWMEEYPSIRLVLDLHRDASQRSYGQLRTEATVAGEPSAQLMLVLGTKHARYEENLSLGLKLHSQLERLAPGITRPLQLRSSRFNQDLCPGALLVEVGAAGNTHAEAMTAAEVLAQAITALSQGTAPA